jgi:pyrimidine operon attenuation protein/uracil phosphoribosyltransferase
MLDLDAEAIYRTLLSRVREQVAGRDVRLVGIHTGGVWIAERLKVDLGIPHEVGTLDVSFYRDDVGLRPIVPAQVTDLPPLDGACVVLVDDVLFTGRTVRAALDALPIGELVFDHATIVSDYLTYKRTGKRRKI